MREAKLRVRKDVEGVGELSEAMIGGYLLLFLLCLGQLSFESGLYTSIFFLLCINISRIYLFETNLGVYIVCIVAVSQSSCFPCEFLCKKKVDYR